MARTRQWYCGGYGGLHITPSAGRHFFVCSKCRWSPNHVDTPEHKAAVIAAMQKKKPTNNT